jgi:hypothetical protein
MSNLDKESLAAIERRLIARAGLAPPAGHRDRVLAAVRDTLAGEEKEEKVPATKSGDAGELVCGDCPDLVAGTFSGIDAGGTAALVAMAVSVAAVIVAPWVAVTRPAAAVAAEPRIVMQARAAGIDLQVAAIATMSGPTVADPSSAPLPDLLDRRHEAWRLRNLLTGEL